MASGTIKNFANDSGTNYCKMPDGTLIQWGDATIQLETDKITVNFPLAFVNTSYAIGAIGTYVSTKDMSFVYAAQTATTIDIYRSGSDLSYSMPFKWFAIGRWK